MSHFIKRVAISILRSSSLLFLLISFPVFSQTSLSKSDSIKANYDFILAANNGNVKEVNISIKFGVNLDYRDENGGTALFYACNNGHLEVVKTLLYYGADPNIGTNTKYTPLMNMAANGDFEMAQILLYDTRTNLNQKDRNHATAIHYAAYYGNYFIVDMLLFYQAEPYRVTRDDAQPLLLAAFNGDTAIAGLLIGAGNSILRENLKKYSPLKVSIQQFDTLLFDYYMERISNEEITNSLGLNILDFAIKYNNEDAVNKWLNRISLDSITSLQKEGVIKSAYSTQNPKLIKRLQSAGLQPDWKPVFTAVSTSFSTAFNAGDYMSYFSAGVVESKYHIDLTLSYGTRFKARPFLHQIDEVTFYQYLEKRHVLALNVRKNFLVGSFNNISVNPFVDLGLEWHSGTYNGLSEKIPKEFVLAPELGFSIYFGELITSFSYQYANYGLYEISPHHLKLGIGLQIPFYKKPVNYSIQWM